MTEKQYNLVYFTFRSFEHMFDEVGLKRFWGFLEASKANKTDYHDQKIIIQDIVQIEKMLWEEKFQGKDNKKMIEGAIKEINNVTSYYETSSTSSIAK